jgi:hypothetical protein
MTKKSDMKIPSEQVKRPCYLSRDDQDRNNRVRKRPDICKYCLVNRTNTMGIELPAKAL